VVRTTAYACPAAIIDLWPERKGQILTFAVTHVHRGRPVRLHLAGELDLGSAPELNAVIARLVDDGHHCLVVELHELTFCDSTGMAAFVRGDKRCATRGGWLRLSGARGIVARVLRVSGLDEVLVHGDGRDDPAAVQDPA
jgi:anti-sigma B factor antagonist